MDIDATLSTMCLDFEMFRRPNEWSPEVKCNYKAKAPIGSMRTISDSPLAAYQRGPYLAPLWQQDTNARILLPFAGDMKDGSATTLIYTPKINTWTQYHFEIQPPQRYSFTLTTWCETNVILFGGRTKSDSLLNDTWLFNGETETWHQQHVQHATEGEFIAVRDSHAAVVLRQPLSNCTCDESILVYGGHTDGWKELGDLWEMRCIADSRGRQQFYWISLFSNDTTDKPSLMRSPTAVSFNKSLMYVWDKIPNTSFVWQYNLTSTFWKRYHVRTQFFSTGRNFFYYPPLNSIILLRFRWYHIYFMNLSIHGNGSIEIIAMNTSKEHVLYQSNFARTVLVNAGKEVLIFVDFGPYKPLKVLKAHFINGDGWVIRSITFPSYKKPMFFHPADGWFVADSYALVNVIASMTYSTWWQYNLVTSTWNHILSSFAPQPENLLTAVSSTLQNSRLVFYSKDSLPALPSINRHVHINSTALWVFHAAIRRWTLCLEVPHQHQWPIPRYNISIVDMGNGSLLIFGKQWQRKEGVVLNDVWRVDVCDQTNYAPVRRNCVEWLQLTKKGSTSISPGPLYVKVAFMVNGTVFVLGWSNGTTDLNSTGDSSFSEELNQTQTLMSEAEIDAIFPVLPDLWQFDIYQRKWNKINQAGSNPFLARFFMFSEWKMAQWGAKVVVVSAEDPTIALVWTSTFVFDVTSFSWHLLAVASPAEPHRLAFWQGKLLMTGMTSMTTVHFDTEDHGVLSFLIPECPAAHYSKRWETDSCKKCPEGSYAAGGATHCSLCAEGLTTNGSMPTSLSDCVCRKDYCHMGECIVVQRGDKVKSAMCRCAMGYTGTTCKYPTYFLVAASGLGVATLVLVLVFFTKRMLKYRRGKRDIQEELTSAHRVWTIDVDEVREEERIDGDTPGSYGEVYRATYRDMTVAVKHLNEIMLTNETIRKEFEREVEVMRTIRHPNIIMFFGAGTIEREINGEKMSFPFLVIEFMSRGTLKKTLNSQLQLSYKNKVSIALDTARGMRYLHSLSPPRIHRDIKSANLLVSHSWVVKVSDFGSARVVKKQGERQPTNVSRSQRQRQEDNVPLLRADSLLTRDTGTILWRAPEIFALDHYGTSADVYSYGIVLWELLCRQRPYEDRNFEWMDEVSRAVQSGIRPTIPAASPPLYVKLMKECWSTNPDRRPTFAHIVDRLVALSDVTPVSSHCEEETISSV